MIHILTSGISAGFVLTSCTALLHADLDQNQFVEAVGLLGLNPETLAAAGVAETDLIAAYEAISESDAQWADVSMQRDLLRTALDALADSEDGEGMQAVEAARASFSQAITTWRDSVTVSVPHSTQGKIHRVVAQSLSGLPAYLLVQEWTPDELSLLVKGIADLRRHQHDGLTDESEALSFYLNALSDSEVLLAKANWDARKVVYTQRFTEQLITLD